MIIREIKIIEEILKGYKGEKNLVLVANKVRGKLIYICFILNFNEENYKIFRVEFGDVYYILTDDKKVIDDLIMAMEMGVLVEELPPTVIPEIVVFIGDMVSKIRELEKKIRNKILEG
jgi:hypothetical protein